MRSAAPWRCGSAAPWRGGAEVRRSGGAAALPSRRRALALVVAAQHARGAGLLARAGVPVHRPPLDGLVDRRDEMAVLGLCLLGLAGRDRGLEAAEVRPDRRGV